MVSRSSRRPSRSHSRLPIAPAARARSVDEPNTEGILSPELRRFFDAMASHFPGHMMQRLMRPDGSVRYTYVSPGIAALGLDRDAILAAEASPQDWIHPDDALRWKTALATSAASLQVLDEEVRILGVDGRVRWVRSIGNPRQLTSGDVVWDGLALDVTAMREAMDAMRLAKAQADTAEAQKARLLAGLEARLAAPLALLRGVLESIAASDSANLAENRELPKDILSTISTALELLTSATVRTESDTTFAVADHRFAGLTPRQREVLSELAKAKSNREIASVLGVTEGTVKLHVVSLLRALGLANRTEAAALAIRSGL
jgi:DNA-binding NarL/FixJ family response regulator